MWNIVDIDMVQLWAVSLWRQKFLHKIISNNWSKETLVDTWGINHWCKRQVLTLVVDTAPAQNPGVQQVVEQGEQQATQQSHSRGRLPHDFGPVLLVQHSAHDGPEAETHVPVSVG